MGTNMIINSKYIEFWYKQKTCQKLIYMILLVCKQGHLHIIKKGNT